jgi:hypothetical protein
MSKTSWNTSLNIIVDVVNDRLSEARENPFGLELGYSLDEIEQALVDVQRDCVRMEAIESYITVGKGVRNATVND